MGRHAAPSYRLLALLLALTALLALVALPIHPSQTAMAAGEPLVSVSPLVTGAVNYGTPDIYQDVVVYNTLAGLNSQAYSMEITSRQAVPLTTVLTSSMRPRVFGSSVIWVSGTGADLYWSGDALDPVSALATLVAKSTSRAAPPAIYGGFAAYQDRALDVPAIRIVELATGTSARVASGAGAQDFPSLADGLIAFEQSCASQSSKQ